MVKALKGATKITTKLDLLARPKNSMERGKKDGEMGRQIKALRFLA